jgi:hypothetical protein
VSVCVHSINALLCVTCLPVCAWHQRTALRHVPACAAAMAAAAYPCRAGGLCARALHHVWRWQVRPRVACFFHAMACRVHATSSRNHQRSRLSRAVCSCLLCKRGCTGAGTAIAVCGYDRYMSRLCAWLPCRGLCVRALHHVRRWQVGPGQACLLHATVLGCKQQAAETVMLDPANFI